MEFCGVMGVAELHDWSGRSSAGHRCGDTASRQLPFDRRLVVSRCQLQHGAVVTPPWSAADVAAAESLPCRRSLPPPIRLGLVFVVAITAAAVPIEYLTDECKLYGISAAYLQKRVPPEANGTNGSNNMIRLYIPSAAVKAKSILRPTAGMAEPHRVWPDAL
ncbi:hypothetical protein ACI65C_004225 [Semiaphis heraclei]